MNRIGILVAASFLGLLIVGACSSDSTPVGDNASADGGTGPGTGPVRVVRVAEVREALKPLAAAECKWLFRCCNAEEQADELGPGPTADDCADRVLQAETVSYSFYSLPLKESTKTTLRQLSRLGYGFDYGRVTIDAAAVKACADSISAAACNTPSPKDHCEPKAPVKVDPCAVNKLLVGKQQAGDECDTNGADCAAGLFCQYTFTDHGVCLKSPKMGDTCFGDGDCGSAAICEWSTGKCVDGADFGAACSYADPDHPQEGTEKVRCRAGLICDTATLKCSDQQCAGGSSCQVDSGCPAGTTCINYRCGKPVKAGAQCSKATDCEAGLCRYDQVIMRQICASPAVDGSRCEQDDDCASHYCKFGTDGGACAPQLALNAPCPSGEARECASHRCQQQGAMNEFACVPGPAVNDPCLSDPQCNPQDKLYCVAMKCNKAPFETGSDCTTAQQCKSEVCLATKCAAKGQAGASCGTAKTAPCDTPFYCDAGKDASPEGTCTAKKLEGAPCTSATECWSDCRASHGELRCVGIGPGQPHCAG
jgi:hypothetical protein